MEVSLERCKLVLMTTLGCNAVCGHCYLNCSPAKMKHHLSGAEMVALIRDADRSGINHVVFSGGEPFIFPQDLFMAINEASELCKYISIRTNGFWAASDKIAERALFFLWCKSVYNLGVSYDAFHSGFVGLDCIKRILRISKELGLEVWLDWVGGETRQQVWEQLGDDMCLVRVVSRPVRIGRATLLTNGECSLYPLWDIEFESNFSYGCGNPDTLQLEVYPEGVVNLSSCCYANPRLLRRRGDGEVWIEKLAEEVENDPAIDFLFRYGVGGLIRKAREEMPALLQSYYTSDCEACHSLLGRLFPVKGMSVGDYIGEDGDCVEVRKLVLMTQRLCQLVDGVSKDYVEDIDNGYALKVRKGEQKAENKR